MTVSVINRNEQTTIASGKLEQILTVMLQQADKAWPEGAAGREWHLFPIEDPVDEDHDLGRVLTPRSLAVLKQELSRAAQTLAEGGTLEQVLREHQ